MSLPVLYSFRRCPYAIRARLAIKASGLSCELREVVLKNKPQALHQASPKATVPVLIEHNLVVDESINIMRWALSRSDPDTWLAQSEQTQQNQFDLVLRNDQEFKYYLDRYKYFDRYPGHPQESYLQKALVFLEWIEGQLSASKSNSLSQHNSGMGFEDFAILPFVRQFAFVDKPRFDLLPLPKVQNWLEQFLQSELFQSVMYKYPEWAHTNLSFPFGGITLNETNVHHDTDENTFFIDIEGEAQERAYMKYTLDKNVVDFYTTFVPDSQRGKGLAAILVDAGMAWANKSNHEMKASCWYAAKKLERASRSLHS